MRIENLRTEGEGTAKRVLATVHWEDCDRKTVDIYFQSDAAFAEDLTCNPDAFLVGAIIPAFYYGERRVQIAGEICPHLREGLYTAMTFMRHWFFEPRKPLTSIEAKVRSGPLVSERRDRAGFFFSGGIDSFATLVANRLNVPSDHPYSIKDGLVIHGLHGDDSREYQRALDSLSDVANEAGIAVLPVYTNLLDLGNRYELWLDYWHGAILSSVAHVWAGRLSRVYIASTFDIPALHPYGSHPVLDPNYGSCDVQVLHDAVRLSRIAKVELVAEWNIALRHLQVCNNLRSLPAGEKNCGTCEKCVRTKLDLLAVGKLSECEAFPVSGISEEMVNNLGRLNKTSAPYYRELVEPLSAKGHRVIVQAMQRKLSYYDRMERLKDFDRTYLFGMLLGLKRIVRPTRRMAE